LAILQLSKRGLRERIEQELQESPVLDFVASDAPFGPVADPLAVLPLPIEAQSNRMGEELSDIIVEWLQEGELEVRVPDEALAHLVIDRRYFQMHEGPATAPLTREYLGRMIQRAQHLLEAVERRRAVLTQVGVAIFRQQQAFLERGPGHIHPVSVEQVALQIGAPTTTVWGAVKNKQVRTPHGVMSLDCFLVPPPRPLGH
jgi:DNA-directed RNA polymerase specialized sigma54-like protein